MHEKKRLWRRLQVWLKWGDMLRRPMGKAAITWKAFKAQLQPDIEYEIWERTQGTYSNMKGGKPLWRKLKRNTARG